MMRKVYFFSGLVSFLFVISCTKSSTCGFRESSLTATDNERAALADSIEKYGIRGTLQHPAGFYYRIDKSGAGDTAATLCSTVSCNYWGGFFDGRGFDSSLTQPFVFSLGQMIVGWQKGIPLVKSGSEITLYIPPTLGFGNTAIVDQSGKLLIPANSFLVFKITVLSIR